MVTTIKESPAENVIAVCTPNKNGLFSERAHLAHAGVGMPLNTSVVRLIVSGKPVDDGRNELVELAKQHKAKYLLFLDDDTLPPPNTLLRLMGLKAMVASGVYYTKSVPTMPVLLMKDIPGGYDKWEYGDIFKVDYIGMGCCLIDMKIFDLIEKPYFKFWKGSPNNKEYQGMIGEDVWFCERVRDAGFDIWVDSGVQCHHEDHANGVMYFHWNETGTGAWQTSDGIIRYFPAAGDPARPDPTANAIAGKKVCWGYAGKEPEGFEEARTADANTLRSKYKDIEAVKIRDVLEYSKHEEASGFLVRVARLMKDGAEIEIIVPDSVEIAKSISEGSDGAFLERMFGPAPRHYQTFYTKKLLADAASFAGIKNIEVKEEAGGLVLRGCK